MAAIFDGPDAGLGRHAVDGARKRLGKKLGERLALAAEPLGRAQLIRSPLEAADARQNVGAPAVLAELAVAHDVDADFCLLPLRPGRRTRATAPRTGPGLLAGRFSSSTARAARRPRDAAGVRREYAVGAALHASSRCALNCCRNARHPALRGKRSVVRRSRFPAAKAPRRLNDRSFTGIAGSRGDDLRSHLCFAFPLPVRGSGRMGSRADFAQCVRCVRAGSAARLAGREQRQTRALHSRLRDSERAPSRGTSGRAADLRGRSARAVQLRQPAGVLRVHRRQHLRLPDFAVLRLAGRPRAAVAAQNSRALGDAAGPSAAGAPARNGARRATLRHGVQRECRRAAASGTRSRVRSSRSRPAARFRSCLSISTATTAPSPRRNGAMSSGAPFVR